MDGYAFGVEMTDEEIAAFLARQGHGVLSFGGDIPYGLPISFGYDVVENRCVFQLVFGDDSRKKASLEQSPAVSLVAYEWRTVDDWQSVIIDGHLASIPDETPEAVDAASIFAEYASVVALTVFEQPLEALDSRWYELTIDEMRGRKAR